MELWDSEGRIFRTAVQGISGLWDGRKFLSIHRVSNLRSWSWSVVGVRWSKRPGAASSSVTQEEMSCYKAFQRQTISGLGGVHLF